MDISTKDYPKNKWVCSKKSRLDPPATVLSFFKPLHFLFELVEAEAISNITTEAHDSAFGREKIIGNVNSSGTSNANSIENLNQIYSDSNCNSNFLLKKKVYLMSSVEPFNFSSIQTATKY